VLVKPFEAIGYSPKRFHLVNPDAQGRTFSYYTFDEQYRPEFVEIWEIIGLRFQSEEPWLLDLQLLHIEQEDRGDFLSWQDGDLDLSPERLQALVAFLEALGNEQRVPGGPLSRFRPITVDELVKRGLRAWVARSMQGGWYQYLPSNISRMDAHVFHVFKFPIWTSKHGANQTAMLKYDTYDEPQRKGPGSGLLDVFDTIQEVSVVTFDQVAFDEFLLLLKQHTYETFVSRLQDHS
jgi:hypothetical protein